MVQIRNIDIPYLLREFLFQHFFISIQVIDEGFFLKAFKPI